jgi:hypothetical protein
MSKDAFQKAYALYQVNILSMLKKWYLRYIPGKGGTFLLFCAKIVTWRNNHQTHPLNFVPRKMSFINRCSRICIPAPWELVFNTNALPHPNGWSTDLSQKRSYVGNVWKWSTWCCNWRIKIMSYWSDQKWELHNGSLFEFIMQFACTRVYLVCM